MSIYHADPAWLLLADGTVFAGRSFGAKGTAIGEAVFTTSVTGWQEILTDPSYYGQLVVQTFPLVGNYGTNDDDVESDDIYMKGYIVREWCDSPSNFRAKDRIDSYLKRYNTIGLFDIDTRALTRHLRINGSMNAAITTLPIGENKAALLEKIQNYKVEQAIESITCLEPKTYPAVGSAFCKVALVDYGYKRDVRENLRQRGCDVIVVPATTTAAEITTLGADAILLSNGPGNPNDNPQLLANVKEMTRLGLPIFGISMGHQLLAEAMGLSTRRMNHGHRGGNQPVIDLATGKTNITAQNHGYVVETERLTHEIGEISHKNANDQSCEGILYHSIPAFGVQFDPQTAEYDAFAAMLHAAKEEK